MPDMPRTKFNSPWTVENIEAELNGTKNARGALTMTEKLAQKVETSTYAADKAAIDAEIAAVANAGAKNLLSVNGGSGTNVTILSQSGIIKSGKYVMTFKASDFSGNYALSFYDENGALINLGSLNGAITADKSVSFTLGQDAYAVKFVIFGTATISELMLRPAAITDDTFVPYAKTNRDLTVLTDEDRASLVEIVDGGAKNKFSYGELIGITTNFSDQPFVLPKGDYKLIFTSSASTGTFAVRLKDAQNTSIFYITANNVAMTRTYDLTISTDAAKITFYSSVSNDFTNVMICSNTAWKISQAYQPYRPSWQELTTKEQQNENNILLNTKYGGGRNVGNFAYYGLNPGQSIAAGTITHTESNGEFTFTGAADSSKNYACYLLKKQLIKAGNYVISGISGGSTSTYWFRIGTGVSDTFKMNVTDSGTTLTLDSDTKITLQLVVKSGVSLSNKVFSPMIITAADWANSHDFQQYGESNAQLSSIVQADIDNMTEFKFAKLDELNSSVHFKYGFLIGGGGASSPNKVMLWHIFVNTSNSVYFTKIIGDDTMTLTGSISDGVLTITSSATIYGGLRLIWLG